MDCLRSSGEDATAGLSGTPPPMLAEAASLFPYISPVCLHPSFVVLDFLFHKARIAFCSVYITPPCGAPGQGLLDVITSNNNSGNGNRALHLSRHQFLWLEVAGRLCETEFTAQMQQECNTRGYADKRMGRAVHDGVVPWTNGAYRLVVPNC